MTSQGSGPTIGPLGTQAAVLGGAAAGLTYELDNLTQETMAPYNILPVAQPITQPFWDGCKEGKLMIQRCQGCGYYQHPPNYMCIECRDRFAELKFEEVSGRATLYTHYMCYDTSVNGFENKVPYAVLIVELEEQPELLLMSNLLNHDPGPLGENLPIGLPLEVVFEKANDDITIPQFRPRQG